MLYREACQSCQEMHLLCCGCVRHCAFGLSLDLSIIVPESKVPSNHEPFTLRSRPLSDFIDAIAHHLCREVFTWRFHAWVPSLNTALPRLIAFSVQISICVTIDTFVPFDGNSSSPSQIKNSDFKYRQHSHTLLSSFGYVINFRSAEVSTLLQLGQPRAARYLFEVSQPHCQDS